MAIDGSGDEPNDKAWLKELAGQRQGGSGARPRGRAVSSALTLPRGVLPRDHQLRALLATIDSVHGDGDLPRIPVRWGVPPRRMVAQYRTVENSAQAVSLMINPNRSRWKLATAHEIGHFLDHQGIGDALTMASRTSPLLLPWRHAVSESRAFRTLVEDFGAPPYLTAEEELWARSYAQWIALRGGDETLRTQVVQSRGSDPKVPVYFAQSSDDDFDGIADEITQLFRSLEWID